MYKEIVVLSILVVAVTSFPSNDMADLGTTRLSKDNNSTNIGGIFSTEHKSLLPFDTSLGNPEEIIEGSANSKGRVRNTRGCILSIASDCSENGIDVEELLIHVEQMQKATLDHIDEEIEELPALLAMLLQLQRKM